MKTAFRRKLCMSAAALLAGICAPPAEAQILTYKHWFGTGDAPPMFVLPEGSPTMNTGFPANVLSSTGASGNTFMKLRNDTVIRCQVAADFDTTADTTIIQGIVVDGGKWGYGKGHAAQAGAWTADFWGITMIGATPTTQIPAGPHTIEFWLGAYPFAEVHFYPSSAVLSCFEEFPGLAQ